MSMTRARRAALALIAPLFALTACGSTTTVATPSAATPSVATPSAAAPPAAAPPASASSMAHGMGHYIDTAAWKADMAKPAAMGATVLFFHASWCPDCRKADASLTTDGVPDGMTVVKVDYDTATELKQTYGVTQQFTFVLVDGTGAKKAVWTGTHTGAEIKAAAMENSA